MKNVLLNRISAVALTLSAAVAANGADAKVAMLIGANSVNELNAQEAAAARFLTEKAGGELITEASEIDASVYDCIWIHIDRVSINKGWENLPAEFKSEAVVAALKKYVADGGNLYLSKYATQLVVALDRVDAAYAPGIVTENGEGGEGTDVWTVNAHLGYWKGFLAPEEERDVTQVYDRRDHDMYKGLSVWPAHCGLGFSEFETDTYPLEGTGDGTPMHREDHNCMWDLNAYSYTAEGRNTMEKFEAQTNSTIIGTWGHVVDFAVAGIVEFMPETEGSGAIIANGLAACEWAPRSGVNKYHDNLEKLTTNVLAYMGGMDNSFVAEIEISDAEAAPVYYNLQGVRVAEPANGMFIKVEGRKASKVIL
ncbi:MAG: DUF4960 domain-containing protein [Muribaculaceae bacterium]|nr:DUF4960 domain-containing protein [Muribaculaceae bacterium]MDE6131441.1 DUF4960 domain-containing protein [Muribaculaceae bacterium]